MQECCIQSIMFHEFNLVNFSHARLESGLCHYIKQTLSF